MTSQRKVRKKDIKKIVQEFRRGILDGKGSLMMCYAICLPLRSYLRYSFEIETDLIEGTVYGANHYWLQMIDGTIIDPTADQFDYKMPKVYIGKAPEGYEVPHAS